MVDANPCAEPALWGLTRDDGTRRPVTDALKVAIDQLRRVHQRPASCRWRAKRRAGRPGRAIRTRWCRTGRCIRSRFDKPGNQRVTALWNGDGSALRVRIRKNGSSAQLVDRQGNSQTLQDNSGWWVVDLPAATAYFKINDQIKDPEGYHFIGGDPLLIVENGVDAEYAGGRAVAGRPGQRGARVQGLRQSRRTARRSRAARQPSSSPAPTATRASPTRSTSASCSGAPSASPTPKDGSTLPARRDACPATSSQATRPRCTSKQPALTQASTSSASRPTAAA